MYGWDEGNIVRHVYLAADGYIRGVLYAPYFESDTSDAGCAVLKQFSQQNCSNADCVPSKAAFVADRDFEFCRRRIEAGTLACRLLTEPAELFVIA